MKIKNAAIAAAICAAITVTITPVQAGGPKPAKTPFPQMVVGTAYPTKEIEFAKCPKAPKSAWWCDTETPVMRHSREVERMAKAAQKLGMCKGNGCVITLDSSGYYDVRNTDDVANNNDCWIGYDAKDTGKERYEIELAGCDL